jgi:HSP20 family protein
MLAYINDWNRTLAALDQWACGTLGASSAAALPTNRWPSTTFFETEKAYVLEADVPGIPEQDIGLVIEKDVLTLSGERKRTLPEGHGAEAQPGARAAAPFKRSFALPGAIDVDAVAASVKDGVLTVTLPKALAAQPRRITVKTT